MPESGPKTTGSNSPAPLGWVLLCHTGSSLLGMMLSVMVLSTLVADEPVPPPLSVTLMVNVSVDGVSLPSWS